MLARRMRMGASLLFVLRHIPAKKYAGREILALMGKRRMSLSEPGIGGIGERVPKPAPKRYRAAAHRQGVRDSSLPIGPALPAQAVAVAPELPKPSAAEQQAIIRAKARCDARGPRAESGLYDPATGGIALGNPHTDHAGWRARLHDALAPALLLS